MNELGRGVLIAMIFVNLFMLATTLIGFLGADKPRALTRSSAATT